MKSEQKNLSKGSLKAFPDDDDDLVTSSIYNTDLLSKCTLCPNPPGSPLLPVNQMISHFVFDPGSCAICRKHADHMPTKVTCTKWRRVRGMFTNIGRVDSTCGGAWLAECHEKIGRT